jgi:hypothetical protein
MHLATHVDLLNLSQDSEIWFNFKSNLTSAISDLANHDILVSYVSRHNAMAYGRCSRMLLQNKLEVAEQCEMDWGYCGSAPGRVKCPSGLLADPDPAVMAMPARVRSWHERVDDWFKYWGILNAPYCHNTF